MPESALRDAPAPHAEPAPQTEADAGTSTVAGVTVAGPAAEASPAPRPSSVPARPAVESGWSPRLVRLGAPRPVRDARRAHRLGVPLVPLLVAALVATAFLAARGGTEQTVSTGGDPVGVPSPVAGGDARETPGAPAPDAKPAGTREDGVGVADTPTTATTTDGISTAPTPTRGTATPERSAGTAPTPSHTGRTTPTPRSTPSAKGGGGPVRPVSFEELRVGDCFDIDRGAPGTGVRRACDTPHNAELVARLPLTGLHTTDTAIREAATLLCREPLRRKAARQPLGTRWTTFVQYPYRTSYLLGSDTVACSLAAPSANGGTLSHRLR